MLIQLSPDSRVSREAFSLEETMSIWNREHLKGAANRIVNCRDFCGNEREAFRDYCEDYNLPQNLEPRIKAFTLAAEIWEKSRQEAMQHIS